MSSREGVCLVLGAGGFRGMAHIGVLQALQRASVPVCCLIGVSIGGLVVAFHAALGFTPETIAERLGRLSTTGLFALGLARRSGWHLPRSVRESASPLLRDLERLEQSTWRDLHFGIEKIGLLALDLKTGQEVFASTLDSRGLSLSQMAIGGASIPLLFPAVRVVSTASRRWLVDGGLSHSLPVERALAPPFNQRRVLAVDLRVIRGFRERMPGRWRKLEAGYPGSFLRICPAVTEVGTVFFRREQGAELIQAGFEAVSEKVVAWLRR